MLLLVIDAELDHLERSGRETRERPLQRLIDMCAKSADLVQGRPAEHSAPRTRVPRALRFVIAVEQEGVALVERMISPDVIAQHERFEKPRRVRQVPFGWRGVREGLDRSVGVAERRGEAERQLARREQPRGEVPGGLKLSVGRHQRGHCHETAAGASAKFALCSCVAASRRAIFPVSKAPRLLRLPRRNARQRRDGPTGG